LNQNSTSAVVGALAGGTGAQRRVASVQLAVFFDTTANACNFDIQATAQYGGDQGAS
jgi:hypothetical protein